MANEKKAAPKKAAKTSPKSENFMEKLKQFVRTEGCNYLQDKNITSIGIGYKRIKGKPTKELSVQFTVERKSASDILTESLDTTLIPKTVEIGGVTVPTDVIQRDFKADYQVVAESATSRRKMRLNPIEPGISVGNKKARGAGTIGCIVFDKKNGTPYVLTNWHVLHGPEGNIGDEIVQPGPFDDNRTHLNRLGKLVRSHLGAAGDCAIASIEDRSFKEEIIDLGVKIEQLGEPELDDKVIKSGRTTNVTHGIVTRIHTIAKIDYEGSIGEQSVGGFEIGPDENNPALNDEISMGGDSGCVWLFKASNGKTSKVMAGLHFAGEGASNPDEHAIACYPRSVFEKLEISLTPTVAPVPADEVASDVGYNPNFLSGKVVNIPKLSTANNTDAFKKNNSPVFKYTHFSLTLSKSRKFAFWVGWNIDGGNLKKVSRKGIPFILDPNIPANVQIGDELYSNNRLDRGHIARRADLLWGSLAEAKKANKDSFYFTNITPQMDNFNQGGKGGIWGKLEDALFEEVDVDNLRVSVFGGPIFKNDDRVFRGVKIPREFFKVLVFVENGDLKAKGFILTQSLDQLELFELNAFKVFEAKLSEIEQRCGFTFPDNLKEADGFAENLRNQTESISERKPLETVDEIVW